MEEQVHLTPDASYEQMVFEKAMVQSNLPKRLWSVEKKDIPEKYHPKISKYVLKWDETRGTSGVSIFISGNLIMGENVMSSMVQSIRGRGYLVYCVTPDQMRLAIQKNYAFPDDQSAGEYFRTVRCLCLYNLEGVNWDNDWLMRQEFQAILKERFNDLKSTIVITGQTAESFFGEIPKTIAPLFLHNDFWKLELDMDGAV